MAALSFRILVNGYIRRIQNNGTVTTLQTKKYTNITGVSQENNKEETSRHICNV